MNNIAAKFVLVLPAVKPGDFGPCGLAVYGDDYKDSRLVRDGDVVEAIGEVEVSEERDYDDEGCLQITELGYRKVRLADGFEGTMCWSDFDGRSGMKAV